MCRLTDSKSISTGFLPSRSFQAHVAKFADTDAAANDVSESGHGPESPATHLAYLGEALASGARSAEGTAINISSTSWGAISAGSSSTVPRTGMPCRRTPSWKGHHLHSRRHVTASLTHDCRVSRCGQQSRRRSASPSFLPRQPGAWILPKDGIEPDTDEQSQRQVGLPAHKRRGNCGLASP